MKRFIVILVLVTPVAALLFFCSLELVPARGLTGARMEILKQRILQSARLRGELPKTPADLPPRPGADDNVQDGWGRDLTWTVSPAGIVTLHSLGRDGRPGGTGEDADITRSFPARTAQGAWSAETVPWSADSLVP